MEEVVESEDGNVYDPAAVRLVTQQWVEKHMKNSEHEYTTDVAVNIFCGTWNVNARKQERGLKEWLLPASSTGQSPPDVYVIGFQEIVDLNAINVAINSSGTASKTLYWKECISECLGTTATEYTFVTDKSLVGLLVCVFLKKSLMSNIRDVRTTSTGVGIMGMMGNKGAVAVRFSLFDSSMCFVCAHLAAHRENVAGRNADFRNIIDRTVFESLAESDQSTKSSLGPNNPSTAEQEALIEMPLCGAAQYYGLDLSILDHEVVFWFGDLNYRICEELTIDNVFAMIEKQDWGGLRKLDQLNMERASGTVFQDFSEATLTFAPTYKYQPGTDAYDTRAEKKVRAPAWCDRILYRTAVKNKFRDAFNANEMQVAESLGVDVNRNDGVRVEVQQYERANLLASDHKPVSGRFLCRLKRVIDNKEMSVFEALRTVLASHMNSAGVVAGVPKVVISGLSITKERLRLYEKKIHSIEIKNVGTCIAHWHFCKKIGQEKTSQTAKSWITLSCGSGLLLPGEGSTVKLCLCMDLKTAQRLNAGQECLEDVLVIRVEGAQDFYISVSAVYDRSCFGMSLSELVCTPGPVRYSKLPGTGDLVASPHPIATTALEGKGGEGGSGEPFRIPKELWRLVDLLAGQADPLDLALRQHNLFRVAGEAAEISRIRESLDTGAPFPTQCSVHSVLGTLLELLSSLPEPLLPAALCPAIEVESVNLRPFCRSLFEALPTLNSYVLLYAITFFREILKHSAYNRTNTRVVAAACMQSMTHYGRGGGDSDSAAHAQYMESVLVYLLSASSL